MSRLSVAFESSAPVGSSAKINSGFVKVKLCTAEGIQEKTYSKKDGEIYKKTKKLDAGEKIYWENSKIVIL